jgi:hypothetical protein
MSKLTLRIDELKVESFDTAETSAERGTVAAHESRPPIQTDVQDSCECTFAPSCNQTNCRCMGTVDLCFP